MAEGEVDLVGCMRKVIVKGQSVIVLLLMMVPEEVSLLECDVAPSFKPSPGIVLKLSDGKYRNPHPLIIERSVFDDVENIEPPDAWKLIPESEEKPDVIAVGVDIILNQEVVFISLLCFSIEVGSTNVT